MKQIYLFIEKVFISWHRKTLSNTRKEVLRTKKLSTECGGFLSIRQPWPCPQLRDEVKLCISVFSQDKYLFLSTKQLLFLIYSNVIGGKHWNRTKQKKQNEKFWQKKRNSRTEKVTKTLNLRKKVKRIEANWRETV